MTSIVALPREVQVVGIVGWGEMGKRMGPFLLESGWRVVAFDTSTVAMEAARAEGADTAGSLAELGAVSDLILVLVVDDAQTIEAVAGHDGLLTEAREGTIVGIGSSVRPSTSMRLAEEATKKGVHILDLGLLGGERNAETRSLRVMAGGDVEVVNACRDVLSVVATDVCHTGPVGTGQIAKTANNILLWACLRADLEVLRLGRAFGVPPNQLRALMAISSGANRPLLEWGLHRPRWPKKDLDIALGLADEANVEMPFIEALGPLIEATGVEELQDLR